jgi:competence protein ComEC
MTRWGLETAADPSLVRRSPAAPVAIAAMAGILGDRLLEGPVAVWWGLLAFAIVGGLGGVRSAALSALVVLAGWSGLFGLWHNAWWGEPPAGDVFHVATDAGLPVVLRGRTTQPSWLHTMSDGQPETVAIVDFESLVQPDGHSLPISGTVRLQVLRTEMALPAGAQLRVVGRLQRPPVAMNPDGFDYRAWLQMRGVTALLRATTVDAVTVEEPRPTLWSRLQNSRHELRNSAVAALGRTRFPHTAAIGEALLLGSRNRMPDELRLAFSESGVLHVLAISGINVSIIWLGLIHASRALGLSLTAGSWCVMIGLGAYAWLTDANPPIVRAATFAIILQAGELTGRRLSLLQGLSLAALAVLALNPTDLFNPGAQLSFLAVAVLAAANRVCDRWRCQSDGPAGWPLWSALKWGTIRANLTTGAVWLATAPLVAWRFHLVSFVGLLLNIVLGPLTLLLLWTGYLWLVAHWLFPGLAEWLLALFELQLHGLITIAVAAAAWPAGHWYLPSPPGWWVAGFYGLLGLMLWSRGPRRWPRQAAWLLLWTNVGLAWGLWPTGPRPLLCEVIAVRHGLAVLITAPNGRTLGYDVGSLGGGEFAAAAMCDSVWRSGARRLDALLVSHADADHCNGVPFVSQRLQTGTMCVHRTFLDLGQPAVVEALDAWAESGGTIRLVAAGDRLQLDPDLTIEVWQPADDERYARDNANSLVVLVEYAGRKLLLTGDLERDGLNALLRRPRTPVDLLLSPHHGSKGAHPPELAAWTNPDVVLISSGDRDAAARLRPLFDVSARIENTAVSGAIRCEIDRDGQYRVHSFHPRR